MKATDHVWVLIPAARPHIPMVNEALDVLGDLANHAVVVTNGLHPPTNYEIRGVHLVYDRTEGINISRWWNLGLDWIEEHDDEFHHVLVMNADTRIKMDGVLELSHAMDMHPRVVMAGPMTGRGIHVEHRPGFLGFERRIPGYCFMIGSRNRIRVDEQFEWWCGDDDLEWRAREQGGTALVGPIQFRHLGDGIPRDKLAEIAAQDVLRFEAKWGIRPW